MRLIAAMLVCLAAGIAPAGDVADSADRIRPLLIGSSVPSVSVSDVGGKSVALGELLRSKRSILVFYRGGW